MKAVKENREYTISETEKIITMQKALIFWTIAERLLLTEKEKPYHMMNMRVL